MSNILLDFYKIFTNFLQMRDFCLVIALFLLDYQCFNGMIKQKIFKNSRLIWSYKL